MFISDLDKSILIAPNVREALAIVHNAFIHCGIEYERGSLVLGGGTVLASRWNHRLSTDLDFFVDAREFRELITRLKEIGRYPNIDRVEVTPGFSKFVVLDTTPVSVFTTRSFFSIPPIQREASTNIQLEHTTEILAKKMYGRIMQNGEFAQRDFYDFCIASVVEPESWQELVSGIGDTALSSIIGELKHPHSSPLIRNADRGDDIIEPSHPQIVEHLWDASLVLMLDGQIPEAMIGEGKVARTQADVENRGLTR